MKIKFIITLILTIGSIVYYIQLLTRIINKTNLALFDIGALIAVFCLAIITLIESLIDAYEKKHSDS